jgi:hypothetical protein
MTVTFTWTNPAAGGSLDLTAGVVVLESVWDAIISNLNVLGGTTGLVHTGAYTVTGGITAISGITATGVTNTASVSQFGIVSNASGSVTGTSELTASYAAPTTAAAAYTVSAVIGFHAGNPTKGAGSIITSAHGVYVDPITTGNSNNYGIMVQTPSGASGNNHGIYVAGGAPAIYVATGGITVIAGDLNVASGRVFAGANAAASQAVNVPNGNGIGFRNGANSGDCTLTINSSNQLGFTNFATAGAPGAATGSLTVTVNGVVKQIAYT